jgi:hypothetical protein
MTGRIARPAGTGPILVLLAFSGCSSTPEPGAARCGRIWNDRPPADLDHRFDEAIVYRWTDKAGDDGCGVIFVFGAREPWVIFGGVVVDGRVGHRSRVDGARWGEDGPEGDVPREPNLVVFPGGLLSEPV